jgi:sodium-coupled neutral amino acid transporter 2
MILFCFVHVVLVGDVISGTTSSGIHHSGILEGWFGVHWWTGRTFVIVFTTLAVFAPLVSLKRIGECVYFCFINCCEK